jgi:phospholipase C
MENLMKMKRRELVKGALLASGAAMTGASWLFDKAYARALPELPISANSGVDHIVVVTMENRSFDHFMGWLDNADGQQEDLSYRDKQGVLHPTHSLSGDFTGCPHPDPDHSYDGGRIEYANGQMDGFLRAGTNDEYSIGYYGDDDIPFYASLAEHYTTCDRYFPSILGPTFPNRMFLHAAQTDRLSNTVTPTALPTIWDRLIAAGVSAKYYFSNLPFLGLWGPKYVGIAHLYQEFLNDAQSGNLPAVSFVDPIYTILDDGTGNDDHPHADIRRGDRFLYDVFEAVAHGPGWSKTVLVINFDEWGGFFDHVKPPRAAAANLADPDMVGGKTLLGIRVPTVVASPFSAGRPDDPRISSLVFDHTSVLKLIEWRWGLAPLTPRDASNDIKNLAYALNFERPHTRVPVLPKPDAPAIGAPCLPQVATSPASAAKLNEEAKVWKELGKYAAAHGFAVR